jgi:hypothetical protein
MLPFIVALSIFIIAGCGDDNITNSNKIPAELVGTWKFSTVIEEGWSYSEISQIRSNLLADYGHMVFNSDGTWSWNEYTDDDSLVYSHGGTFSAKNDTIKIVITTANGEPIPTPLVGDPIIYGVVEDILTMIFDDGRYVFIYIRSE